MAHKNFFQLYHEVTKNAEPPVNFQAWTAVAVLSALLGKKCFIPQGHFTVFPNLYIVLIGDPGTRKSTAMNIGKKLVRLVERVPIAPESSSREALIDTMADSKVEWTLYGRDISYWQSAAFVGELEQFFGGKHINQQMVGFLTAIWDEPFFEERTRKSGKVTIQNPYFSLLGCCTMSWMNTKLRGDIISDGFSRRTIFVHENKLNTLNPWPEASDEDSENMKLLQAEAVRIFNIAGQFNFTPEARQMWDHMYASFREQAKEHSEKVQHYFSSKHILVQKLCMCFSAAYRNDRVVDTVILKLACRFLEVMESNLDEVFAGVGRNEYKQYSDRVVRILSEEGAQSEKDLFSRLQSDMRTDEFIEVKNAILLSGRATVQQDARNGPRYQVVNKAKPREVVNLLQLACHTEVSQEKIAEGQSSSALPHLLDPATELLKSRQPPKVGVSGTRVLLPGKRPKSPPDLGALLP